MTLPWYPRDMGKYARDTGTLSLAQHGAYNLLLDHYYSSGPIDAFEHCSSNASLMPDHSGLYRLCNAITKWEQEAVDFVLKKYFVLTKDGFYHHDKCDEVIEKQTKKHEKRVAAGKKKGTKNPEALLEQCSSNALQKENQNQTKILDNQKEDFSEDISEEDFLISVFDISKVLTETAIEEARKAAPGWDVYVLMGNFNEAIRGKKLKIPDKPDKAFPAWCKSVKKGKRPP